MGVKPPNIFAKILVLHQKHQLYVLLFIVLESTVPDQQPVPTALRPPDLFQVYFVNFDQSIQKLELSEKSELYGISNCSNFCGRNCVCLVIYNCTLSTIRFPYFMSVPNLGNDSKQHLHTMHVLYRTLICQVQVCHSPIG